MFPEPKIITDENIKEYARAAIEYVKKQPSHSVGTGCIIPDHIIPAPLDVDEDFPKEHYISAMIIYHIVQAGYLATLVNYDDGKSRTESYKTGIKVFYLPPSLTNN